MKHVLVLLVAGFLASDEEAARSLFEKAEEYASRGLYLQARKLFRQVEAEHPGTEWAGKANWRTGENALLRIHSIEQNGPPENRVDVFFLGDGYTLDPKKQKLFDSQVEQSVALFHRNEVFGEYRRYFNFHQMNIASREDGVDLGDREYDTPLDAKASGGAQGQVTVDHGRVHEYLSLAAQSDSLAVVIVRLGTLGTGGGGVAVVGGGPGATVMHEWGHAFGWLADEYSQDTGHRGGPVGRAINISDTPDLARVPWKHFIEARVPGVGAFEGAAGRARGAWKPTVKGCVMGSGGDFCVVCREALVLRIYGIVDPIDEASPEPSREPLSPDPDGHVDLTVVPMAPSSHKLVTTWYLERVDGSTPPLARSWRTEMPGYDFSAREPFVRMGRGPLAPITGEPVEGRSRRISGGKTEETLRLERAGMEPGLYRVTVEVRDPTDWVILDEKELLASRRSWLVRMH